MPHHEIVQYVLEEIIIYYQPFSATATYTFKVNGGIIQSLAGVNTITFSFMRTW